MQYGDRFQKSISMGENALRYLEIEHGVFRAIITPADAGLDMVSLRMATKDPETDEQYSEEEASRRLERALRRSLTMPPPAKKKKVKGIAGGKTGKNLDRLRHIDK